VYFLHNCLQYAVQIGICVHVSEMLSSTIRCHAFSVCCRHGRYHLQCEWGFSICTDTLDQCKTILSEGTFAHVVAVHFLSHTCCCYAGMFLGLSIGWSLKPATLAVCKRLLTH